MALIVRHKNPKKFYTERSGKLGLQTVLYAECRDCGEHHHIKTIAGPYEDHEYENPDNRPRVNGRYVTACVSCGRTNN